MADATIPEVAMDEVVALCKRRGFVFPSSEIYGGLGSTYDYGHYGVLLRNNFKSVLQIARKKPPFGIAQIGKSFRNEITTGNFVFRTREFEQMEMEFFVEPSQADAWHRRWMDDRVKWYLDLGIRPDHLQLRKHGPEELSNYSSAASDIEYLFPMGWSELEGVANRGDFDLTHNAKFSGEKLEYFDQG